MPNPQPGLWSDNPNIPKVPYDLYFHEKTWFAGVLIASIFYGTCKISLYARPPIHPRFIPFIPGVIVAVFFQRMAALFNPVHR